jgi:hypothetical protein
MAQVVEEETLKVQWSQECSELLDQVLETQTEIASLLKHHDSNTESLVAMKKQCDEEVGLVAVMLARTPDSEDLLSAVAFALRKHHHRVITAVSCCVCACSCRS